MLRLPVFFLDPSSPRSLALFSSEAFRAAAVCFSSSTSIAALKMARDLALSSENIFSLDDPTPLRIQQEIGFEGQLSKPVKYTQLVSRLNLLMHTDTLSEPLEEPPEQPLKTLPITPVQAPVRLLVVDDHLAEWLRRLTWSEAFWGTWKDAREARELRSRGGAP